MTIDEALDQFLDAQGQRLAPTTFARYADVVDLLRSCLNRYGHQWLAPAEARRWQAAYDAGDEEAFCHLFGAEKILEGYGEFLGYFMVRKVMASEDLLRAAGTVTRKLARWLADRGHVDASAAQQAAGHAAEAGRQLPRADRLAMLLHDVAALNPPLDTDALGDDDWIEDYLAITRVEPGRLWFEGRGPIAVPDQASDLAEVGWEAFVALARVRGEWRLLETGFVYPV